MCGGPPQILIECGIHIVQTHTHTSFWGLVFGGCSCIGHSQPGVGSGLGSDPARLLFLSLSIYFLGQQVQSGPQPQLSPHSQLQDGAARQGEGLTRGTAGSPCSAWLPPAEVHSASWRAVPQSGVGTAATVCYIIVCLWSITEPSQTVKIPVQANRQNPACLSLRGAQKQGF